VAAPAFSDDGASLLALARHAEQERCGKFVNLRRGGVICARLSLDRMRLPRGQTVPPPATSPKARLSSIGGPV